MSLRRADHSSRGVLPTVLRRCVWSRNIKNGCSIYIYDISRLRVNYYLFFIFFSFLLSFFFLCFLLPSFLPSFLAIRPFFSVYVHYPTPECVLHLHFQCAINYVFVQEILCALPPFYWWAVYLDTWFWPFREPLYSYAHPFPLFLLRYAVAGAVVARLSPRSLGLFLRPSCGICGSQNGASTGFLWVLRFPLVDIFSPKLLSFVSLT